MGDTSSKTEEGKSVKVSEKKNKTRPSFFIDKEAKPPLVEDPLMEFREFPVTIQFDKAPLTLNVNCYSMALQSEYWKARLREPQFRLDKSLQPIPHATREAYQCVVELLHRTINDCYDLDNLTPHFPSDRLFWMGVYAIASEWLILSCFGSNVLNELEYTDFKGALGIICYFNTSITPSRIQRIINKMGSTKRLPFSTAAMFSNTPSEFVNENLATWICLTIMEKTRVHHEDDTDIDSDWDQANDGKNRRPDKNGPMTTQERDEWKAVVDQFIPHFQLRGEYIRHILCGYCLANVDLAYIFRDTIRKVKTSSRDDRSYHLLPSDVIGIHWVCGVPIELYLENAKLMVRLARRVMVLDDLSWTSGHTRITFKLGLEEAQEGIMLSDLFGSPDSLDSPSSHSLFDWSAGVGIYISVDHF